MRSTSIGRRVSSLALVLLLTGVSGSLAPALGQQSALPASWQQLSAADFATLVQGFYQQGTFQSLSPTDQMSLAMEGAQLFSQVDLSSLSLSHQTLGAELLIASVPSVVGSVRNRRAASWLMVDGNALCESAAAESVERDLPAARGDSSLHQSPSWSRSPIVVSGLCPTEFADPSCTWTDTSMDLAAAIRSLFDQAHVK